MDCDVEAFLPLKIVVDKLIDSPIVGATPTVAGEDRNA